jgi:hypothetical protein
MHGGDVLVLVQKSMTLCKSICMVCIGIQFIFTYRKVIEKRKVLEISTTLIDMLVCSCNFALAPIQKYWHCTL